MNIIQTTTVVRCNFCGGTVATAGADGAVRLAAAPQPIDACAVCAEKALSFLATTYKQAALPVAPQRVRLANGQVTLMPPGSKLPAGATLVSG
jgi:hypothetical protein